MEAYFIAFKVWIFLFFWQVILLLSSGEGLKTSEMLCRQNKKSSSLKNVKYAQR